MFSRTGKGWLGKKDLGVVEDTKEVSPDPAPVSEDVAVEPVEVNVPTPLVEPEMAPIIPTPEPITPKIHPSTAIPAPPADAPPPSSPRPVAAPVATPTANRAVPVAVPAQGGGHVIGEALTVDGNVTSEGILLVQGTVNGDVKAMDVTIHKSGRVNGAVIAHMITVEGHVSGRIEGGKVRLAPDSVVRADITHNSLSMADGADFEGSCARKQVSSEPSAASKVSLIDPSS